MKFRLPCNSLACFVSRTLVCCVLGASLLSAISAATKKGATTQGRSVAIVRSLIKENTRPCRIDNVRSISAARSRNGWRVTARLVMSGSGTPRIETAVWIVGLSDGKAVPASELSAETGNGCPL